VFMLISRAKVRPGAAGSGYAECSDWLLQIAALIRYARSGARERQMYLAVLAGPRINAGKHTTREGEGRPIPIWRTRVGLGRSRSIGHLVLCLPSSSLFLFLNANINIMLIGNKKYKYRRWLTSFKIDRVRKSRPWIVLVDLGVFGIVLETTSLIDKFAAERTGCFFGGTGFFLDRHRPRRDLAWSRNAAQKVRSLPVRWSQPE